MISLLFEGLAVIRSDWVSFFWVWFMGFLVISSCGLVGTFLVLRKSALLGDAISHAVVPGIVVAFLLTKSRNITLMMGGALAAGFLTVYAIEKIAGLTRVKRDAAIGLVFAFFFAVGLILISSYAGNMHLDAECVLYGEIDFVTLEPYLQIGGMGVAPTPTVTAAVVLLATAAVIFLLYKEFLVTSFDPTFAMSMEIHPTRIHYTLMTVLTVAVVSAFESVGAILVVAMLILPASTAYLVFDRLPIILWTVPAFAAITAGIGVYGAVLLNCSTAGAMVVSGFLIFLLTWIFVPGRGLIAQHRRRRAPLEAVIVSDNPSGDPAR